MGESTAACLLLRSFSHPSDSSREAIEGDPLQALGESISFGRFMSEPLSWEKWSSFSHNRYLEEVEKFSKPGSVAQKKAYFEAHYKRIKAKKAAALLEQENQANDSSPEPTTTDEMQNYASADSNFVKSKDQEKSSERYGKDGSVEELVDVNGINSTYERNVLEIVQMEEAKPVIGRDVNVESPTQVELPDSIEINGVPEEKMPKDASNKGKMPSKSKEKQVISASKLPANGGSSKLRSSAMITTPGRGRKGDNGTPNSKKPTSDSMEKKRCTLKSLHMSINFSSRVEETSKISSPVLQKIGNSRIGRAFSKISNNSSTPRQIPTRASVGGVSKLPLATAQPERLRARKPFDPSVHGSRKAESAKSPPLLSRNVMKSSSECESKARYSTLSSSFSFRSEERAAKRKEFFQKLQEKVNSKEAERMQQQTKSKAKAENDFRKMRQSIGLKGKPFPDSPREVDSESNNINKIPPTKPRSPKLGRTRASAMPHDTSSRPPRRPSVKTDGSKNVADSRNRPPNRSSINNTLSKRNMHENASPNIQMIEK